MSPLPENESNQTQSSDLALLLAPSPGSKANPLQTTKDERRKTIDEKTLCAPSEPFAPLRETREGLDERMDQARAELKQRVAEARKQNPRPRPWYIPVSTPDWLTEEMIEEICNLPPATRKPNLKKI